MSKTAFKTRVVETWLFFLLLSVIPPLQAVPLSIKEVDIIPLPDGDALEITYEGDIGTLVFTVDRERHAILKLSKALIDPKTALKRRKGKLVSRLRLENKNSADTILKIGFKRRLGRHTRKLFARDGKNIITIELLDEALDKAPEPTPKSVIQPMIEKGVFTVDGSKDQKVLDYNKENRKQLETDEFLSLFGTSVKPRPNRMTAFSYELDNESVKLKFSLHHKPDFLLRTRANPPRAELKINKVLGDFEINHLATSHDFLGNLTTTRDKKNTLTMQVLLSETAQASSKVIKRKSRPGYQFIVNIKRIYPWETDAAIPDLNIR